MEDKKMLKDDVLEKVNGGIESSNIVGYDSIISSLDDIVFKQIDISDSDIANEK